MKPEAMIPLVGFKKELDLQVAVVHRVAKEVMAEKKVKFSHRVGNLIEAPCDALTADETAPGAGFCGFSTQGFRESFCGGGGGIVVARSLAGGAVLGHEWCDELRL